MPPVTTPARIELAEILLEPAPTPFWRALRQIGVDRAVGVLPRHHFDWREARVDMPWDYVPLKVYQELLAEEGFSLDVIEDNPPMEAIRLGRPGREEEFEIFAGLVRNMGRLGIPVLCYNWAAVLSWVRTSSRLQGRAGAAVSGFDAALLEGAPLTSAGVVPSEDLVRNLGWFLERIVPIAEEAGVRGKAVTPFLLSYVVQASEGRSLEVNLDLARNNVRVAGKIATEWSQLNG